MTMIFENNYKFKYIVTYIHTISIPKYKSNGLVKSVHYSV